MMMMMMTMMMMMIVVDNFVAMTMVMIANPTTILGRRRVRSFYCQLYLCLYLCRV